ncbi:MAG: triose-phosphate isomerase [Spirochaetia bacterium]|nr:triose-phosphate isomerase [Spirochaetia bacterium]
MARIKYIAGNWKMNKLSGEAVALAQGIVKEAGNFDCKIMIAPPFTALCEVGKVVKGTNVLLGAQNMSNKVSGAYTGEVSPEMLKDLGVSVVILGHSERRGYYGETDEFINSKIKLALEQGLDVILCVGETLAQREAGKAADVVTSQVQNGLKDISECALEHITIAYEPVWAIGTGKTATAQDADAIHKVIREKLASLYSADAAEKMIIQYGGSMKPENAAGLLAMPNIDGGLIGGAALKADSFVALLKCTK